MQINTIELNIDKYESMLKELGVLKTENEELKKRLLTSHNTDYASCSHVVDLICDVLTLEKSENMEINLHTIYSEVVEIKRIIRDLREKFS